MIYILVLAFVLRIVGIHFGLPNIYHQDEPIIVNHAMGIGAGGWNTLFFVIPPFTTYFLFILYGFYYFVGKISGLFAGQADFAIQFLKDPTFFYLIGRLFLGVAMGVATVAVAAKLGEKVFSRKAGLWAAFFLAILPIHVRHSHYIYADVPVTLAVTLLLLFLLVIKEKPSFQMIAFAGLALGWAVSIKYTAAYFAPMAALFIFFVAGLKKSVIFTIVSLAVFFLIAPYTILDWPEFHRQMSAQAGAESSVGLTHHFFYSILQGAGWPFVLLACLGFWRLWTGARPQAILVTAWIFLYYLINAYFSQPFERYMMPIVPVLALLAGEGWLWTADKLALKKFLKNLILCAVVVDMLLPTLYSDFLFVRKDTRTQCLEWVEKNVPAGSVIAVDSRFWAPPLTQTEGQVRKKYDVLSGGEKDGLRRKRLDFALKALQDKKTYEVHYLAAPGRAGMTSFLFMTPLVKAEWPELRKIKADYVILNYAEYMPEAHALKEAKPSPLETAAVFSPYRDPSQRQMKDPYGSTAAPHLQEELFGRVRLGPYLEVYKIKK